MLRVSVISLKCFAAVTSYNSVINIVRLQCFAVYNMLLHVTRCYRTVSGLFQGCFTLFQDCFTLFQGCFRVVSGLFHSVIMLSRYS